MTVAVAVAALIGAAPVGAQPAPVCGNGVVEAPETCDDGNVVAGDGCSVLCELENLPPDCTGAAPGVSMLWPPNHRFVPIPILGVTDPDGDPVAITVAGVTQDEPLTGGDGNTCPDATGVGPDTASVRSERSGHGDGRVYHLHFEAADGRGGTCVGMVEVCVRHDNRPGGTCSDGGEVADSTVGLPPAECEGEACGPADCAPDPDDLAPPECAGDTPPAVVTERVARARDLLGRAAQADGRRARRLGHRAAQQLRKAAATAAHAAHRDRLSDDCAEEIERRLEAAGSCAMCSAG